MAQEQVDQNDCPIERMGKQNLSVPKALRAENPIEREQNGRDGNGALVGYEGEKQENARKNGSRRTERSAVPRLVVKADDQRGERDHHLYVQATEPRRARDECRR